MALMRPSEDAASPPTVQEARAELRSLREQLGLVGGAVLVVGVGASAAGIAVALPLMGAGLAAVGLVYFVPLTKRGRWAHSVLASWEEGKRNRELDMPMAEDDPRLIAAAAMLERIADHAGEDAASTAIAGELHDVLYDSLDDIHTVELLRAAAAGAPRASAMEARADELGRRVEARMDQALASITDIFEAVLAHDNVALRRVLDRATDELRQLRAVAEVETLLSEPGEGSRGA